jgi:GH15 family glucan-1,4-alpha-glucosidase
MSQRHRGRSWLPESSIAAMLQAQHAGGAFVASPDFAEYGYCWLRDGSFTAYALDCAGRLDAAQAFHEWCAAAIDGIAPVVSAAIERHAAGEPVDPSRMPPARFSLSGHPVGDDWPNFQVDGYGTWLWSLRQHLNRSGAQGLPAQLAPAVECTARYVDEVGTSPCFDVWEEAGDSVHTVTLACVYAGLLAAAEMLDDMALADRAESLRASLLDQARRDGRFVKSNHSQDVDAALLWLCEPFHVAEPGEPAFIETVRQIAAQLDLGGGIRRYPTNTYYGGGAWPVLTASLGWYYSAIGDVNAALARWDWITAQIDERGRLGEQFGGDGRDPTNFGHWVRRWGRPARELVWSHAMYVVLAIELEAHGAPANVAAERN